MLVSLFIPVADTEEKTETREHRVVTCAERWKKTASEIPTGEEEEEVAAVMYLQGNETSGGSDGKEQRTMRENRRGAVRRRVVTSPRGKPGERREIGSLIAYLGIDSSVEVLNETVNIC